ncbi:MAG: hypothetical protein JWN14_4318 [Chthonomonadales bacterium]|nr:hypothetical protein [Chthonomonadales bacterium]
MLPDDAVKMGPQFPASEMEFEMREYRPQWSALLLHGALFTGCFALDVLLASELMAMRGGHDQNPLHLLSIPILLLFLPATGCIGWFLFHALATYRVDPQSITRILLGRQTRLLWENIVDFQFGRIGQSDTHWTLTDRTGTTLKVHTGMVERGYGLAGLIDAYLAPLREQKRTQFQITSQVYRCGKAVGILFLMFSLCFFGLVGGIYAASVAQPQPGWSVVLPVCVLLFGGMGVFSLGKALHYFTYAVRITQAAIVATSLFSKKSIAFSQIAAFYVNAVPLKSGQTQRTTEIVGQDGTKIKLDAILNDYEALTSKLQSLMTAPVLEQGEQTKAVTTRSSRRQRAKFQMIVMPLMLLLALSIMLFGVCYAPMGRHKRNSDFALMGLYTLLLVPLGISVSYHGWKALRAESQTEERLP